MARYRISKVEWDAEDEDEADAVAQLPQSFEVTCKAKFFKDELADRLGDAITEQYGFLHKSFVFERID